jgi:hypothetical protein
MSAPLRHCGSRGSAADRRARTGDRPLPATAPGRAYQRNTTEIDGPLKLMSSKGLPSPMS